MVADEDLMTQPIGTEHSPFDGTPSGYSPLNPAAVPAEPMAREALAARAREAMDELDQHIAALRRTDTAQHRLLFTFGSVAFGLLIVGSVFLVRRIEQP